MPKKPSWDVQYEWIMSLQKEDLPSRLWNGFRVVEDPESYIRKLRDRIHTKGRSKEIDVEIQAVQEAVYYRSK